MKIQYYKERKRYFICHIVDGKRKREFFKTKAAAQARIDELQSFGVQALTDEERKDFFMAKEVLKNAGVDKKIYEAAIMCANSDFGKVEGVPVDKAIEEYLRQKALAGRRSETIRDIKNRLWHFWDTHPQMMTGEITAEIVQKHCVKPRWSARNCRNHFCCLQAFLNWCKMNGWLNFNPVFNKEAFLPKVLKKAITLFSVEKMRKFFAYLEENERYHKFIPFYAVQAFAGIRREEAERLSWANIDVDERIFRLPAEIQKVGPDWTMQDLPENLWAWLAKYRDEPWSIPTSWDGKVFAKVIDGWERNGLRHTFATMHVGLYKNPPRTSLILRHQNPQRLWYHYLANYVKKEEAEAYFGILPA